MTGARQESTPLIDALKEFADKRPVYFCIPGHRYNMGIPAVLTDACRGDIVNFDLTEAPGLDDLHNAKGPIKSALELLAEAFGSDHARFLVNGTTCGIEAAITACAGPGEKILIQRNAHRSVLGGLVMSGAIPVWAAPDHEDEFCFASKISPYSVHEKLSRNKDIKAVLVVSPSYYGTISDIRSLADICHGFEVPLITDEAHGAHLYFNERMRGGAVRLGADISVMSAHKTLFSFGQSSWLHVKSRLVDISGIDSALKILMSSSPSYMLMASLDAARYEAVNHGQEWTDRALGISFMIRKGAEELGLKVYGGSDEKNFDYASTDPSRVVISAYHLGIEGTDLQDHLFTEHNIAVEMADKHSIVTVVSGSNTKEDALRLLEALDDVKKKYSSGNTLKMESGNLFSYIPAMRLSPREAYFAGKTKTDITKAEGCTAGESIVVYPPGSALVFPGEIIDNTVLKNTDLCLKSGMTLQTDTGHDISEISVIK